MDLGHAITRIRTILEKLDHEDRVLAVLAMGGPRGDAKASRRMRLHRNPQLRWEIRQRDQDQCRYCGQIVNWTDRRGPKSGSYDHVNPIGDDTMANLVVCCRSCNSSKKDRTLQEAGMVLLEPRSTPKSEPGYRPSSEPNSVAVEAPPKNPPARIPALASKNRKTEAVELLNYLNLKANRSFRPVETTLRYIRARLESGASVEDMKAVINRQVLEWKGTEMEKFLRPETLFNATKFESYLGQKQVANISVSSDSSLVFTDKELSPEQYAQVQAQIKGVVKKLAEDKKA